MFQRQIQLLSKLSPHLLPSPPPPPLPSRFAIIRCIQTQSNNLFQTHREALNAIRRPAPPVTPGRTYLDNLTQAQTSSAKKPWSTILETCILLDRSISVQNFPGILLQFCIKNNNLPLARDFISTQDTNSLAALSNYLRLLSPEDEPEILIIYEKIKRLSRSMWNVEVGDRVVSALCKTKSWRESLEIIASITSVGSSPTTHTYSAIASAAFSSKEFDLGWEIMSKVNERAPIDEPFIKFLETCPPTMSSVLKVFDWFDDSEYYIPIQVLEKIGTFLNRNLDYSITIPSRIIKGKCTACSTRLQTCVLTQEQFETLRGTFFTKVLLDSDPYLNTNPVELQDFKRFIDQCEPFDYVLDGLNVALALGRGAGGKTKSNQNQGKMLDKVVSNLIIQGEGEKSRSRPRVLIIGRKHMANWPHLKLISTKSTIYLTENNSSDDPFLIYASMKSGQHCKFVSRDMFRNHSFRLKDFELRKLFKRWKLSSQLGLYVDDDNIVRFNLFSADGVPVIQNVGSNWHIPFHAGDNLSPYGLPQGWACLTANK